MGISKQKLSFEGSSSEIILQTTVNFEPSTTDIFPDITVDFAYCRLPIPSMFKIVQTMEAAGQGGMGRVDICNSVSR